MTSHRIWPNPPKRVGGRWEYGSLVFWAEGGGIHMLDDNPDPAMTSCTKCYWKRRQRESDFKILCPECASPTQYVAAQEHHTCFTLRRWADRLAAQLAYLQAAIRDQHVIDPTMGIPAKAQQVFVLKQLVRAMEEVAIAAKNQGDLCLTEVQQHYRNHVASVPQTFQVPCQLLPD